MRELCESLSPFLAMNVMERAQELERSGRRILHLELGQPDFETPECVTEAAVQALRDKKTGYTHSLGIMPLREGLAEYYQREYNVAVSPERIVVTAGSSPAMLMIFSLLCRSGDQVILSDPSYACYENFIRYAGAENVRITTLEEHDFQLRADLVAPAVGPRTEAVLINSPSNPAGTMLSRAEITRLAALGPTLVSDEIYHGLVYEGKAVSALEITPEACVLDGFSKRWAMTGWRLGWMVVPPHLVPMLRVLQQNFFICAGSVAQWAGLAALKYAGPDVERMAAAYAARRRVLLDGLRALGFGISSNPVGAFYILADAVPLFGARARDSLALSFDILETAGVGVAPGLDFGPGGEGRLRFSYAASVENIEEALHRLAGYLEQRM
ncbi:MAG: pyridoxal phosphate-dependent aminotransferase [Desulfovibrio sp.]|jgi:aspartate/methionine/tyrosine aminotransferase|nr:pyridoxal phosphate-dependent aminotransferase [Desulfovibrio sp.]